MRNLLKILSAIIVAAVGIMLTADAVYGAGINDRLLNRPYADNRTWHMGFGFGMNLQALQLTNSGYVSESGETWFMDQPSYSPGFSVSGLVSMRLNDYFSVRLTPGLYFGNKEIKMLDSTYGHEASQNIKSTFVVVPVDVKYSGLRFGNVRPYVSGGIMPAFDVSKKRTDMLRLKSADTYLTVAVGGDFYLPYFKLIPELKFCFGLSDVLEHNRPDLADNPDGMKFTKSLTKSQSRMVVLTFYFE